MVYRVSIARAVADSVSGLHPEIKKELRAALKYLAENPYFGKELQEELFGFFSYRFKRYRINYKVDESRNTIVVYMIGHRRDVYELLAELVNTK